MTFAAGLRAVLRQDPDVVLVGEVRDTETAELALRAVADRPPGAHHPAHQRRASRRSPGWSTWASSRSSSRRR